MVASPTITVFDVGTQNLSTIYANDLATPTPLANPFVGGTDARFLFYAANGRYDVQISGGTPTIPAPYSWGDQSLGLGDAGAPAYPFLSLPVAGHPAHAGRLARVTDRAGGLWMDTGTKWVSLSSQVTDLQERGAVGDGVTYDTAILQQAVAAAAAAGGGVIRGAPGKTYRLGESLIITSSHVTIDLQGAELLFQPSDPATFNKAIVVHAGDGGSGFSNRRNIVGAIAIGATTFTASGAGDTADLLANDWLLIEETDAGVGNEIIFVDWVQVASVAGAVVTIHHKFQTAFPGTHSTVTFRRILNLVENVHLANMTIKTTDTVNALVGVTVGIARSILIENVVSAPIKGNAFFAYRSAEIVFQNCWQVLNKGQATEFAAVSGLGLYGNTFGTNDAEADTSAFTLDFGTHSFAVIGNRVLNAANIGVQILYCHDGSFIGNIIGYVKDVGIGNCVGIAAPGNQHLTVEANVLLGGDGAASVGISFGDSGALAVTLFTDSNVIGLNTIRGFVNQYGFLDDSDVYLMPNVGGAGILSVPNTFVLGDARAIVRDKLLHLRAATYLAEMIHMEKIGVSNWYFGPEDTLGDFVFGFNADSDRAFRISQNGVLTAKAGIKFSQASGAILAAATAFQSITPATPLAANSTLSFTIAVAGSIFGDQVVASPASLVNANVTWSAGCYTSGTVTITLANPTTAPQALAPAVWLIVCLRAF